MADGEKIVNGLTSSAQEQVAAIRVDLTRPGSSRGDHRMNSARYASAVQKVLGISKQEYEDAIDYTVNGDRFYPDEKWDDPKRQERAQEVAGMISKLAGAVGSILRYGDNPAVAQPGEADAKSFITSVGNSEAQSFVDDWKEISSSGASWAALPPGKGSGFSVA